MPRNTGQFALNELQLSGMNNQDLADLFDRMADLLAIKGEVIYITLAYRRVAESLRDLPEDIHTVQREGRLRQIPGVGKEVEKKIEELLSTGKLAFLERLEQEVPVSLLDLLQVPDVGPKKVALFWKQANINTLPELEQAAREGRLRALPGMGEKSEARVLAGIEAMQRRSRRMLLNTAWSLGESWLEWLRAQPGVSRAEAAGSLRRWKTTIGDIDLVAAASAAAPVMEAFIQHPDVFRVASQGENKSSVELKGGVHIQLWIQSPDRFGSLLQYATGSKEHNVHLRELALKQGLSLSERGLVNAEGREQLAATEEEIYAALGLPYIAPELREERGEIQAALEGRLPRLLEPGDLQAELHAHTLWSDGRNTVEEMAKAARQRGLKTLAITDHSVGLGIAGGLTVEELHQQRVDIQAAQREMGDALHLLHGTEVDIRADGSLDYPDEVLAELDIVIASMHSALRQPKEAATERLIRAISNPHVDMIGHPSGRLLPNREGMDLDWVAVLEAARQHGVALEINANPNRLDLDEVYARRAVEMGIPLSINTDAHSTEQLDQSIYGVSVARRAWASAEQVMSTWTTERFLAWKNRRQE